jgi:hypothetical protein
VSPECNKWRSRAVRKFKEKATAASEKGKGIKKTGKKSNRSGKNTVWKRREKRMAKNEVDLEGLTKEEIAEIRKAELEIKNSKEFKVGLSPSRPVESRWNPNEEEYYKYKETWTHGITCAFQLSEEWMGGNGNNHFVLKIFGHEGLPDVRIRK